jgi:hypothetical protein
MNPAACKGHAAELEDEMAKAVLAVMAMMAVGCTDAYMAKWGALGDPATIECYSGEKLIYRGKSTGKTANPEGGSDGYQFMDAKTGWLTEVSGNCIVTYGN